MDAVMHGAAEGGGFEELFARDDRAGSGISMVIGRRTMRRGLSSLMCFSTLTFMPVTSSCFLLRLDADHRGHAGGQRGGDEVGGGEGLAFAVVIDRRVGDELFLDGPWVAGSGDRLRNRR
jgi:hypothetical protein